MQTHHKFGDYIHSYFLINLYTDNPITQVKDLEEEHRRTFLHEYTHFLQNISGGYGIAQIWNTYDRSRQLIAGLQREKPAQMHLPLDNSVVAKEKIHFFIHRALAGDYNMRGLDPQTTLVIDVTLEPNKHFESLHPGTGVPFVKLTLRDRYAKKLYYGFGELAIAETMAYLMEMKFFPYKQMDDFPYRACQKLGEFMGTSITQNDEWLFALCDTALLSRYPGWMFYTMLEDMTRTSFTPNDAREIYDYGIKFMENKGLRIFESYQEAVNGVCTVLNDLFQHPFYQDTVNWFQYILQKTFSLRINDTAFMLDLYREQDSFEGRWNSVYLELGTPQLHNSQHQRFFKPPQVLFEQENGIEPLFLLTMQQIQKLLLTGKQGCACMLQPVCSQNTNGLRVDDRCQNAPWERAIDDQSCAYGALWTGYGFANTQVQV